MLPLYYLLMCVSLVSLPNQPDRCTIMQGGGPYYQIEDCREYRDRLTQSHPPTASHGAVVYWQCVAKQPDFKEVQ